MEVNRDRYDELCSMDKSDLILYIILLEREFNINMEIEDICQWNYIGEVTDWMPLPDHRKENNNGKGTENDDNL